MFPLSQASGGGFGSQKYIAYIPQKSRYPRAGYLNGVTMETFWGRDGRVIAKELLATKPNHCRGSLYLNDGARKEKNRGFDRSIPDPEGRYDTVRVKAEIYLVVLENALPDELMVQREPASWSCTVI